MNNFEFYKNKILKACDDGQLSTFIWNKAGINLHALYSESNMIRWLYEEHKEKILTESEKEYLSNVLHPFEGIIITISKHEYDSNFEFIAVKTKSPSVIGGEDIMSFPLFEKGTMYKNMGLDIIYTPEELGL